MDFDFETGISLISLIVVIVGLLIQHFKSIAGIKERLSKVETKTDLFWKIVEKELPRLLKAPNKKRKDELLNKVQNGGISLSEITELQAILKIDLEKKDTQALAAVFLLAALEKKKLDAET